MDRSRKLYFLLPSSSTLRFHVNFHVLATKEPPQIEIVEGGIDKRA